MANLKFHSTVIFTKDLMKMKSFYQNILKQQIVIDHGICVSFENGFSLWMLKPEYAISKKLGYIFSNLGNKNLEICFETDEFDELVDELKEHDLVYLHPVQKEAWEQKTLRFFDPEENLVEVGESMPALIRRLHNAEMGPLGISQKTTLPVDLIHSILAQDA